MTPRHPRGVAMVISNFYPEVGGAEKQALLLSHNLAARGISVFVITRNYLKSPARELVGGLTVVRSPAFRSMRILSSALFIFHALTFILRNREKIDVIHCHQSFSPMTIGGFSNFLFNIPYIVKITASNEYGEANELERLPFLFLRKRFLCHASRFLVVNRQIIKELARFGVPPEKCVWVPNGVKMPDEKIDWLGTRQELREKMQITDKDPVFIFSGRLSEEKGLKVLIDAFGDLLSKFPNARLWILGNGGVVRNIEDELKLMVSEKKHQHAIQFFGRVPNVEPFLAAADVFVLLSVSEGMSNSVLEAMAFKLPSVVTNISAMEDVVVEGQTGFKVSVGNRQGTTQAFEKMLLDRGKMGQMAQQSQNLAREKFAIERIADLIVGIYQEVLRDEQ